MKRVKPPGQMPHSPPVDLGAMGVSSGQPEEGQVMQGADSISVGDITPAAVTGGLDAGQTPARPREAKVCVKRRLETEGRWHGLNGAEVDRDRIMADCRSRGMSKVDAQEFAYTELDRLYPPLQPIAEPVGAEPVAAADPGVSGLGRLPEGWPVLPSNASLQSEIAWVQSSRLDVVEDMGGGGTRVDLSRADSPAPSKAAIGWLETSIRAYSKYCDIAAKATAVQEHDAEAIRREKLALSDVVALLDSMA